MDPEVASPLPHLELVAKLTPEPPIYEIIVGGTLIRLPFGGHVLQSSPADKFKDARCAVELRNHVPSITDKPRSEDDNFRIGTARIERKQRWSITADIHITIVLPLDQLRDIVSFWRLFDADKTENMVIRCDLTKGTADASGVNMDVEQVSLYHLSDAEFAKLPADLERAQDFDSEFRSFLSRIRDRSE